MKRAACVVVFDGSIAAVVAAWLEGVCKGVGVGAADVGGGKSGGGAGKPALWIPAGADGLVGRAAERLVETAQLGEIIVGGVAGANGGLAASAMLMAAGADAMVRGSGGAERVIWPVQCAGAFGDEQRVTQQAAATSRALLAARLLSVDAKENGGAGGGILIDTPVLDLTDNELLELAADIDAPVGLARWCVQQAEVGGTVCGVCDGCRRWVPAIRAAGLVAKVAGVQVAKGQMANVQMSK